MSGTTELAWFKSSYSSGDGDSCVEIVLSWHKSSYSSGSGDDCVEVAACPTTVHVRDSKLTDGPRLALTPGPWTDFVRHASADAV
ncbi:DUF397 domain-containing protein [Streptomyces peucetius]|uniref:DUF397 domain-containing protein n=1 Tax=Streptomyces peucetius TaxID=1950 RepID=A0ABY6IGX9_STRPE|nr:DUF397 domain-containing protein [Streptomyces peucetius]UYQ65179.1 DUF397 domain-containing protein [Streptomyces peucetius]